MAQAAIPLLVGTGIQIIGAKQGWDPRLTAFASIAAGGIGAGMASGAFAGTAASAASGAAASVNPHLGFSAFTGTAAPAATSAVTTGIGASAPNIIPTVTGGSPTGIVRPGFGPPAFNPSPNGGSLTGNPVATYGDPGFNFDPLPYKKSVIPQGQMQSAPTYRTPAVEASSGVANYLKSDAGKSLGVSMLDTFLQYELALAQQPPPRISVPRGGGGGGGGGGASGPAFQGGSGGKKYQVVDFYGTGGTASYQPQPI
jgi:hypothetical protein